MRRRRTYTVACLSGDGIGPELMAPALEVLGAVGDFDFEPHLFGGASIDAHGTALTDEVLEACRNADARCATNGSMSMPCGLTGRTTISCPPSASFSHFRPGCRNLRYCRAGRKSVILPG